MRLLLAPAFAIAAALSAAAQEIPFDTVRLEVDRADAIDAVDLNADGRLDLVVSAGRQARIFLFKPGRGFVPAPDRTHTFPNDVYLWTPATFVDAPGNQIATFSARGIQRFVRTEGGDWRGPEDLIVAPNLFHGAAQADAAPLRLEFLRDLNGDGFSDAFFLVPGGIWIFPQTKDAAGRPRFRLLQKLSLPVDAGMQIGFGPHQKLRQLVSVPLLATGDINRDGRPDLMYYLSETIGQFIQREDGRFTGTGALAVTMDRQKSRNQWVKFEAPPRLADFNADGMLDVAVVYWQKGRVHVYFNRNGRTDFTSPDAVLKVENAWSSGIYVEDLDGDGKPEIIMGVIRKLGIFGAIQTFVSGKIDLELHFHRLEGDTFTNSPAQQLTFSVPYTFQATRESAEPDLKFRPELKADLNGDGLKDLLVGEDDRTLAVHFGRKSDVVSEKAGATIALNPPPNAASTKTFVADFNGDGRSDLVVKYEIVDRRTAVVEVKITKPR
jgi:hypothetical protein